MGGGQEEMEDPSTLIEESRHSGRGGAAIMHE